MKSLRLTVVFGVVLAASSAQAADYTCELAAFNGQGQEIASTTQLVSPSLAPLTLNLVNGFKASVSEVAVDTERYLTIVVSKGDAESATMVPNPNSYIYQLVTVGGTRAQVKCWQL